MSIVLDSSGGGSVRIIGRGIPYSSYTIEYSESLAVPLLAAGGDEYVRRGRGVSVR